MQAGPVPPRPVHPPAQAQPAAARADMPTPARAGGWGEGPMAPQGALMLGPDAWEQKDVLALADELDLEGVGAGPRISTAAAPRGPEQVRKHGLHVCWGGTPASWDLNLHGCQTGLVQVQGKTAGWVLQRGGCSETCEGPDDSKSTSKWAC